jgi:hypothetical protein
MFAAVKDKGLPVALVMFPGEAHGFRQAANIQKALDGEFFFYSRVFGFQAAEHARLQTLGLTIHNESTSTSQSN